VAWFIAPRTPSGSSVAAHMASSGSTNHASSSQRAAGAAVPSAPPGSSAAKSAALRPNSNPNTSTSCIGSPATVSAAASAV